MISQQFNISCHLPQPPCYQLCHRSPDDWPERRRSLIGRLKPNVQQYLAEEPLINTCYKSTICSIHQDVVRTVIEIIKLLNGRPPPNATAEQTLPRKTRTILAQLRIGHSRILGQYINRIELFLLGYHRRPRTISEAFVLHVNFGRVSHSWFMGVVIMAMVGLVEAGMDLEDSMHVGLRWSHVGRWRSTAWVRGDYTDDTRSHRRPGAQLCVGSSRNWSVFQESP